MPREENLKPAAPWKPGQSGNPKGKQKGTKNLSTILREYLEKRIDAPSTPLNPKGGKLPVKDIMIMRLINKALKGDNRSIQEVFDRAEGKAVETVQTIEMNEVSPWILANAPKPVTDEEVMNASHGQDEDE